MPPEQKKTQLQITIEEETIKAIGELDDQLYQRGLGTVGCIDKKTKTKGKWNPPGGAIFIDDQGELRQWMTRKQKGTLGVHKRCAYMFFIQGLITLEAQEARIEQFRQKVLSLNQELGTDYQVEVEETGSAPIS